MVEKNNNVNPIFDNILDTMRVGVKNTPSEEMPSRVIKKENVTIILTNDGRLNLRVTEKNLEKLFFDRFGEAVKVRIRR